MTPTAACRLCRRPLSDLRRRLHDTCERSECRAAVADEMFAAQRRTELDARRRHAAARRGKAALLAAPAVWLQHHETAFVAITNEERARHAAALAACAAEPDAHRREPQFAYPEDTSPAPAVDAPVCGFCRGRCCRAGLARAGFVDADLLRFRQGRHGGSLEDAAAHYLARLPARHVDGSCLYHGEQGCVLPRDERAPVCNGWACPPLKAAREHLRTAATGGAVLAAYEGARVMAAAWLKTDSRTDAPPRAHVLPAARAGAPVHGRNPA